MCSSAFVREYIRSIVNTQQKAHASVHLRLTSATANGDAADCAHTFLGSQGGCQGGVRVRFVDDSEGHDTGTFSLARNTAPRHAESLRCTGEEPELRYGFPCSNERARCVASAADTRLDTERLMSGSCPPAVRPRPPARPASSASSTLSRGRTSLRRPRRSLAASPPPPASGFSPSMAAWWLASPQRTETGVPCVLLQHPV